MTPNMIWALIVLGYVWATPKAIDWIVYFLKRIYHWAVRVSKD